MVPDSCETHHHRVAELAKSFGFSHSNAESLADFRYNSGAKTARSELPLIERNQPAKIHLRRIGDAMDRASS
jgi:hypothetical protein